MESCLKQQPLQTALYHVFEVALTEHFEQRQTLFGFCKPEHTNGKLFETAAVANGFLSCIRSGPDGTLRTTVPVIA